MATNGDPAFTRGLLDEPTDEDPSDDDPRGGGAGRTAPVKGPMAVVVGGSVLGAAFAALSTSDFMQHLDRQVHSIHCSFLPGAAKDLAESGCRTVMMSPYSSFFRESFWGGIPISLWALAVFAFLAYRSALLLWRGEASRGETRFLVAATAFPVAMSIAFGVLSVVKLEATCKVCIGIYAASALVFVGAVLAHRRHSAFDEDAWTPSRFPAGIAEGVAFVAAITVAYIVFSPKPDPEVSMMGCSSLVQPKDTAGVMIPLHSGGAGAVDSIEVLDPLCPSCKAFETRLAASSLRTRLNLKAVLFPLDSECNWMVTEAVHPGACAVSEAVLCAAGVHSDSKDAAAAQRVLNWAYQHQADLRALAAKDGQALRNTIEQAFPGVKGCLGGPVVKSKLTKGLRWAVANAIPVLTPQLFVDESRVCDEDTDLGLEYTLSRMLSPAAAAERARRRAMAPPPPKPPEPSKPVAAIPAPVPAQPSAASAEEIEDEAEVDAEAPAPAEAPSEPEAPSEVEDTEEVDDAEPVEAAGEKTEAEETL